MSGARSPWPAGVRAGALLLSALVGAAGCSREPAPPDAGGEPCDADVQCEPADASAERCGALRACVAGRCERTDVDAGSARGATAWALDCPAQDAASPSGQ